MKLGRSDLFDYENRPTKVLLVHSKCSSCGSKIFPRAVPSCCTCTSIPLTCTDIQLISVPTLEDQK